MRGAFESRAGFEAVIRTEFAAEIADRIIAEHPGREVDYANTIRARTY